MDWEESLRTLQMRVYQKNQLNNVLSVLPIPCSHLVLVPIFSLVPTEFFLFCLAMCEVTGYAKECLVSPRTFATLGFLT